MVSHNLGELGAEEGKPVLVQWRWFDSKPTLPLWVALLLLLVVPKKNHKWQAWLILVVPLGAVSLRLFYLVPSFGSSAQFDLLIQLIVTFAIAWAAVWLLAPYLSTGRRLRAIVSALVVMFAVGSVGYMAYFGFSCSSETLGPAICFWTVCCVSLLFALALSGACCRKTFHAGMIAIWLILWLPLVTAIGMAVGFGAMILIVQGGSGVAFLVGVILSVLFVSPFLAGFLYAVNLPVMALAGLTECYRERLRAMVYRDRFEGDSLVQASLADGNPFEA